LKYTVKASSPLNAKTPCLVIGLKQQSKLSTQCKELNKLTNKAIDQLQNAGILSANEGSITTLPIPNGINASTIIFVGLGDPKQLDTESYRSICNKLCSELNKQNINQAVFDFSSVINKTITADVMARHLIEALGDQEYQYQPLPKPAKQKQNNKEFKITLSATDRKQATLIKQGAAIGHAISNGKTLARNLGNMPGNVCTPTFLSNQAKKLGRSHKLKVKVLAEKDMEQLGMGSLLSVSKGSRQPAKLIIMEYKGAKNAKDAPHALVGKGLTFDAGGISLKPAGKMDEMKYDMCGAASVFGALLAAAELELPINIVGVVPSSENLPDGLANKPGDVVTSMSGQTIEILNTDAEGRLILCDALTYTKRFKPKTVIDIATLTGAVIVALGHQTAGVMGNDQTVVNNLLKAGDTSLDFAWQLPLKETYKKQLKSKFADLANIGTPGAGTITAGCFLSCFTEDFAWAHLDIAGTAWGGSAGKQASGRAVPILTQYLIDQS